LTVCKLKILFNFYSKKPTMIFTTSASMDSQQSDRRSSSTKSNCMKNKAVWT